MADARIKNEIRREVLQKRDSISQNVRQEKDTAIMHYILKLPEFIDAKTILFYASFRSEVDTMDMIKISLTMGKKVVLPKVDKKNGVLRLYEIKDTGELAEGYMHIPEPVVNDDRLKSMADIDLIIIPGAAYDVSGNRLG
ncbi:MAG: 5-formyltetrahydrofolate cyclo-ligase [Nitrospirae bacterium]|nr:5-formyltetrahydrofolate cyclo-ligase [Nitrospirota bacterium]